MKKYALIVAGGKGRRMGNSTPKQFLPLKGKSIIFHTLDSFRRVYPDIHFILVLPKDQISFWKDLSRDSDYSSIIIAEGGKERTDSVRAGLKLVPDGTIVGIHDAVRPFASEECIRNTYETAIIAGNAVPVVPVAESIRIKIEESSKAVDRNSYVIVQTPQCFHSDLIKKAYENLNKNCTDDATVLENASYTIKLVEGNRENIKITEPADLKIAEALLTD